MIEPVPVYMVGRKGEPTGLVHYVLSNQDGQVDFSPKGKRAMCGRTLIRYIDDKRQTVTCRACLERKAAWKGADNGQT